jgi:hypothetical protein
VAEPVDATDLKSVEGNLVRVRVPPSAPHRLRQTRRREGHYLLRTNRCAQEPAHLWQFYIQLVEVEAAFKNLKDDLRLRPIYHRLEHRIEAHIFVAFLAYRLHVTLRAQFLRVPSKPLVDIGPVLLVTTTGR